MNPPEKNPGERDIPGRKTFWFGEGAMERLNWDAPFGLVGVGAGIE
jgi:hypothetical protein